MPIKPPHSAKCLRPSCGNGLTQSFNRSTADDRRPPDFPKVDTKFGGLPALNESSRAGVLTRARLQP